MATPVVTPKPNALQTFLNKAAADLQKFINVGINVAVQEQPLLNQILPPQFATAESAATTLIKNVALQTEAKYAALGTTISAPQRDAEVLAITAGALAQILLGIGVTAGETELTALVTGATAFSSLTTTGLTTLTPTPAA